MSSSTLNKDTSSERKAPAASAPASAQVPPFRPTPPVVADDQDLFRLLLQDEAGQDARWRVAKYWSYYMDMVTSDVLAGGLKEFRSNDRIASSFCSFRPSLFLRRRAAELDGQNREIRTHQGGDSKLSRALPEGMKRWIARHALRWPPVAAMFRWFRVPNLAVMADRYFFMTLRMAAESLHRSPETSDLAARITDSGAGHPTDLVASDTGPLGQDMIYAILYLSLLRRALGAPPKRVVELGGGYGCLCESALKGFEGLECYVIFDLPQTCYITTQYLKTVFPGDVWDYRDFAGREKITAADLAGRRVAVLPTWMMPRVDVRFDCFVNTASFHEMEPHLVRNYLKHAERLSRSVFVWMMTLGHGEGFNREVVSAEFLRRALTESGFESRAFDAPETRQLLKQLQPLFSDVYHCQKP